MATKASRIALAGSNISSTGEVDADLLDNIDSAAFLSLDSNGRLGIGTPSPSTPLHVYNATANGVATFESGDAQGGIALKDNSTTQPVYLLADGNDFKVQTNASERMRINSSGNVGIGTSSPLTALHIENLGVGSANFNKGIIIKTGDGSFTSGHGPMLEFRNEDVYMAGIRGIRESGWASGLQFFTHNSSSGNVYGTTFLERMRIDASGNVGIGTTSPAKKFHVHSGNQSDIVKFENDNGGFVLGKTANLGSLDMASDANFRIRHGSTLSATFKSNGYVGIGETNPQYLLHLAKSGSNYIQIDNDTNSVTSFLGVATDHLWLGTSTNHQLKFYANSDIKMVIDTNGNVGIGTQSAIDKFNVETSSTQTHSTTLTKGTNTPGAWITNSNNDNNMSGLHLATGSGTHFSSIVGARTANASHWGTHLAFYTHDNNTSNLNTATEKMRISGDGYVTTPNQPSWNLRPNTGSNVIFPSST